MSCENMQEQMSLLLDRRLSGETRGHVLDHLASCDSCKAQMANMAYLHAALHGMSTPRMPAALEGKLSVLASHERVRRLSHRSVAARIHYWAGRLQLCFDNMMRPVALPVAGGLLSALLLFGMLLPSLNFLHNFRNDVPLALSTDPSLVALSPVSGLGETVVELTIDEHGRVTDYNVTHGTLTPEMENNLLFSRFAPATLFGQPTWGKVFVSFRHSTPIIVRG
ncbi:MAG TPA: zf-HC2 domain-containing protein [Bryobacteraceae bacterium]|nr:zf-HC2 domain-containing protein [Bryobacteraceae bacterium]